MVAVERWRDGDADGRGRRYRIIGRGRWPYTLTFAVETTRRVRPVRIEGRAEGQWQGVGVWRLQPHGDGTRLSYR